MNWDIAISSEKEIQFIYDRIVVFNKNQVPFTQDEGFVNLSFNIKDEDGLVIAGINSMILLLENSLY